MKHPFALLSLTFMTLWPLSARALTIEQEVTASYMKEHPGDFKITTEKRDDGLIHFTIVHKLNGPHYMVSHLKVRRGDQIVAQSDSPSFAREREVTYYVALAPACLESSEYTLFEGVFQHNGSDDLAEVGGTEFVIHLKDFAPPSAREKKNG